MSFRDLNVDLKLDLSETSMVGLVSEWVFVICDFYPIPSRGPRGRV